MRFVGQPLPTLPVKPELPPRLKPGELPEFDPIAFKWPVGFKFGPGASPRLPTHLDAIFNKFGAGLPIAFLRTLAAFESRMNPRAHRKGSRYYGMFQVSTPIVGKDGKRKPGVLGMYNKVHGTAFKRDDLFNAALNTMVASWYLNRIIRKYKATGIRALAPKNPWLDGEWVKLLVAGWNSGENGVIKVAKWMKAHGAHIDHSAVFRNAKKAAGSRHLQNESKRLWQAALGAVFAREKRFVPKTGPGAEPAVEPTRKTKGMETWLLILIAVLVLRSRKS